MKSLNKILLLTITAFSLLMFANCSGDKSADNTTSTASTDNDPMHDKGIGPVTSVTIGALDNTLADKGKTIFAAKCTACHNTPDIDSKKIGPSLKGVSKRRAPEWIMNQILNPSEMTQKDPIAKDLLATYIAQMANQNLTQDEARSVLEYFRQNDSK
ncbi:MAG TPA: c-type cytochrome [Bacteroidia bacterium]